jgi:hypothetical protein
VFSYSLIHQLCWFYCLSAGRLADFNQQNQAMSGRVYYFYGASEIAISAPKLKNALLTIPVSARFGNRYCNEAYCLCVLWLLFQAKRMAIINPASNCQLPVAARRPRVAFST